jgi:hypothetical protein
VSLTNYDPNDSDCGEDNVDKIDLNLEGAFEKVSTPMKTKQSSMCKLSRFNNNTLSYLSPATKQLHQDIADTSPANIRSLTSDSIALSRKNMLNNIDYMIDYGELTKNPNAAQIFSDMEKSIALYKLKLQELTFSPPRTPTKKGGIEFAGFTGKKKKPAKRLKGHCL